MTRFFPAAVLAACVALAAAHPARAEGSILPLSDAEIGQYAKRLKLTDKQKPTVTAIMKRSREEGEAVLHKHGAVAGKKPGLFQLVGLKKDMKGVVQWARTEVSKILTPVQMREFEKIYDEGTELIKQKLLR